MGRRSSWVLVGLLVGCRPEGPRVDAAIQEQIAARRSFLETQAERRSADEREAKEIRARLGLLPRSASPWDDLALLNRLEQAPPMAALPGGTFTLASGEVAHVEAFSLDRLEVTVEDFAQCVSSEGCPPPAPPEGADAQCNWGRADRTKHPMNCIDQSLAQTYCRWLKKRLPTEWEWEWAARGQTRGTAFPWGNEAPDAQLCWKQAGTCAVGTHPTGAAPGGLEDLAGNVAEWTSWQPRPAPAPTSDDAPREDGPRVVYYDDAELGATLARGGGWSSAGEADVRADAHPVDPVAAGSAIGFRCAR